MSEEDHGIRDRISKQGEEALGRIAEELIGNPLVNAALTRAFDAREKAVQAQEVAMGALGIPSAADIERLTRRLRSVSQRLEGIEDAVDRLDERLGGIEGGVRELESPLTRLSSQLDSLSKATKKQTKSKKGDGRGSGPLEARLEEIARDLAMVREAVSPGEEPPPRAQERLTVGEA